MTGPPSNAEACRRHWYRQRALWPIRQLLSGGRSGKTAVMRQYAADMVRDGRPVTWVTIDENITDDIYRGQSGGKVGASGENGEEADRLST